MSTRPHSTTTIPALSISDCAKRGEVHENTVRRWIADGSLPAYKLGRQVRIHEADFAAMYTRIPVYGGEL